MQIWQDLGNRPLVMIRFNPDSYIDDKGRKVRSCFDKDCSVDEKEWDDRFAELKRTIEKWLIKVPTKEGAEQVNLFYNSNSRQKKRKVSQLESEEDED